MGPPRVPVTALPGPGGLERPMRASRRADHPLVTGKLLEEDREALFLPTQESPAPGPGVLHPVDVVSANEVALAVHAQQGHGSAPHRAGAPVGKG